MAGFSKMVDLLDEDKPIAEQKFVCMSFISPENEIKNKSRFFFEEFVNSMISISQWRSSPNL